MTNDTKDETSADPAPVDNGFTDEPKGDNKKTEELEKAAFVMDAGDGTTSLMKPVKPNLHFRGGISHHNDSEEPLDDDSTESNSTFGALTTSKWQIISNAIFVISSLLYLAMACMVMDTYWAYKDVPRDVYWSDDDATWWNYFVNCTDDGFIPENVTNADDDYTWVEWYNNTAFPEDDNIWLPRIANENAPGIEPYVSKYMILYFWAALGFMITGVIEIVLSRKAPFMVRSLYYMMFIAASFGLVSAILTNKNPLWSNICNCISTNIWALEALLIILQRLTGSSDSDDYGEQNKICGWSIIKWFWVADVSFMFGTFGDAVTSWIYIFEYDNYILGILAIIFAFFWQVCAFVYFAVSIYDWNQYKQYFADLEEFDLGAKALPDTVGVESANLVNKDAGTDNSGSDFPAVVEVDSA